MSKNDERKARLTEFLDQVWSQGNVEACDGYLAKTYTIRHDPGDPWDGQTLDLAEFKTRLQQSRGPFPDQRFDVQEMIEEGDNVVVAWLWIATHLGDIPGFPASGKPLRMSGMTVYGFDPEDRLTGHWQITDRLGIYQQLQSNRTS